MSEIISPRRETRENHTRVWFGRLGKVNNWRLAQGRQISGLFRGVVEALALPWCYVA